MRRLTRSRSNQQSLNAEKTIGSLPLTFISFSMSRAQTSVGLSGEVNEEYKDIWRSTQRMYPKFVSEKLDDTVSVDSVTPFIHGLPLHRPEELHLEPINVAVVGGQSRQNRPSF